MVKTMTQERFVGYPMVTDDTFVPFLNYLNKTTNTYPWKATEMLPLMGSDEVNYNVNVSKGTNIAEHIGAFDRYSWYTSEENALSTAHAMMATNQQASNSATFDLIHSKASDYATPLLKSLYEYQKNVKSIEVHFVNDGIGGASVVFPARRRWNLTNHPNLRDAGCDWLRLPNPPAPSQPIGNERQQARCSRSTRASNILRQAFCQRQALFPDQLQVDGPYREEGFWFIRLGKPIYDSVTMELIACTSVVVNGHRFGSAIINASFSAFPESDGAGLALARWDDTATVSTQIPSGFLQRLNATKPVPVQDLPPIGVSRALMEEMKLEYLTEYQQTGNITEKTAFYNGRYVSIYPTPPPMKTEAVWRPQFFTVFTAELNYRDFHVEALEAELNPRTRNLIRNIVVASSVAVILILAIIYFVSLCLTLPLEWMDNAGKQILQSAGSTSFQPSEETSEGKLDLSKKPWWYKLSPRTEITKLVEHFHRMVEQFSGQGTAKLFKQQLLEVKNPFDLADNFEDVYNRRQEPGFTHTYNENVAFSPLGGSSRIHSSYTFRRRKHEGPNIHNLDDTDSVDHFAVDTSFRRRRGYDGLLVNQRFGHCRSRLFWWIVGCIAVPLLCAIGAISTYVLYSVSDEFPALVDLSADVLIEMERAYLIGVSRLRALLVADIVDSALRDLHVFNRIAGWLISGAIAIPNNTLVDMSMAADLCKNYSNDIESCPVYKQMAQTCDCDWEDPWGRGCRDIPYSDRLNQLLSFEALSEDADRNGLRNSTSYPNVATSPETTEFWSNFESMPGFNESTTRTNQLFDWARLASALSVVQVPLYNYPLKGEYPMQRVWGSYLALEEVGSLSGYAGCNLGHANYSSVHYGQNTMTKDTRLCPEGKYG